MNGATHRTIRPTPRDRRGAALLMALGLLAVFSVLGAAYFKYMSIELDLVELDVQKLRAQFAAEGGVRRALGELLDLQSRGEPLENALGEKRYRLPVYGMVQTERTPGGRVELSPQPLENLGARMTVRVAMFDPEALAEKDPAALANIQPTAEGALVRIVAIAKTMRIAGQKEYLGAFAQVDAVLRLTPDRHEFVYWNGSDRPPVDGDTLLGPEGGKYIYWQKGSLSEEIVTVSFKNVQPK